jgi:hypothetical protein
MLGASIFTTRASAETTPEAFASQANELCAATEERLRPKIDKVNDGRKTLDPYARPVETGKALRIMARGVRPMYREISALERPVADAVAIGEWIGLSERGFRQLGKSGGALIDENLKRFERHNDRAFRLFSDAATQVVHLGLSTCVE